MSYGNHYPVKVTLEVDVYVKVTDEDLEDIFHHYPKDMAHFEKVHEIAKDRALAKVGLSSVYYGEAPIEFLDSRVMGAEGL
ncbi:hypothetical protein HOT75_gp149 [Gordonia phage Daredevil]|uniref:Uncharacterized protein n=1 Tax=Gordonia phage Daredevil TaxID=2283286 RepID=A0A345MJ04_9CAUD|nr:hypothetical protein HOT75_gp149 [Gordonia phage Daredevil]AXH70535.1 hypothetical protein SEA_DAREDEVIL_149 [Gordonia phage Daredevil]